MKIIYLFHSTIIYYKLNVYLTANGRRFCFEIENSIFDLSIILYLLLNSVFRIPFETSINRG